VGVLDVDVGVEVMCEEVAHRASDGDVAGGGGAVRAFEVGHTTTPVTSGADFAMVRLAGAGETRVVVDSEGGEDEERVDYEARTTEMCNARRYVDGEIGPPSAGGFMLMCMRCLYLSIIRLFKPISVSSSSPVISKTRSPAIVASVVSSLVSGAL